jgi:hypothetical protein
MDERIWKLRSKIPGVGPPERGPGEQVFTTEAGFIFGLQTAWRAFATDISATLPNGTVLDDAALRGRYPNS